MPTSLGRIQPPAYDSKSLLITRQAETAPRSDRRPPVSPVKFYKPHHHGVRNHWGRRTRNLSVPIGDGFAFRRSLQEVPKGPEPPPLEGPPPKGGGLGGCESRLQPTERVCVARTHRRWTFSSQSPILRRGLSGLLELLGLQSATERLRAPGPEWSPPATGDFSSPRAPRTLDRKGSYSAADQRGTGRQGHEASGGVSKTTELAERATGRMNPVGVRLTEADLGEVDAGFLLVG